MRSNWKGVLRVGELVVPVGLGTAIAGDSLELRLLHRPCMRRIQTAQLCPEHGAVPVEEIARAFEIATGEYVLLEAEELETLTGTGSRTIETLGFWPTDEALDPKLIDKSYWLVPSTAPVGRRAYVLLAEALLELGFAAVCRFTWKSERLCAIARDRVTAPTLALHVLHFDSALVRDDDIVADLEGVEVTTGELRLAKQLLRNRKGVPPEALVDRRRPALHALVERKLAGGQVESAQLTEPEAPPAPSFDLSEALKRSIAPAPTAKQRSKPRARPAANR